MARPYQRGNGRIVPRGAGGRFRHATMADVGLATCAGCGMVYAVQVADVGPRTDPAVLNHRREFCPDCGGYAEALAAHAEATRYTAVVKAPIDLADVGFLEKAVLIDSDETVESWIAVDLPAAMFGSSGFIGCGRADDAQARRRAEALAAAFETTFGTRFSAGFAVVERAVDLTVKADLIIQTATRRWMALVSFDEPRNARLSAGTVAQRLAAKDSVRAILDGAMIGEREAAHGQIQ